MADPRPAGLSDALSPPPVKAHLLWPTGRRLGWRRLLRVLAGVAVGVLLLAGLASAMIVVPPTPEQLVEGHTVFMTLEVGSRSTTAKDFAAAVAVLVKEYEEKRTAQRFPGVLWFNDQYVVEPEHGSRVTQRDRTPCTGAVIAVNRGGLVDRGDDGRWTLLDATYNESYYITDVNDHSWIVDQWFARDGLPAWSVAILNNQATYNVSDDGKRNCATFSDRLCIPADVPYDEPICTGGGDSFRHKSPGDNGRSYPNVQYNALLYMRLVHLFNASTPKDHREGSGDWWNDTAGCHADARRRFPCPALPNGTRDDDREGNSHPFHPDRPWPLVRYAGEGNHGGSVDCADGSEQGCHATREIDLYYGRMPMPLQRRFAVYDLEGSQAPFHCHDDTPNGLCEDAIYDLPGVYTE